MANPLTNEKELYERIKNENIGIIPEIWDLLYHRIGDDLTAINLLCHSYISSNQPIPIEEAQKIMFYTRHIKDMVNQITIASKEKLPFPEFQDNIPLHPVIREMLTHYIGNDIYVINFMVQDTIDPIDPRPIPIEIIQKILTHTHSIREFMERLRVATTKDKVSLKLQEKPKEDFSKPFTKDQILHRIRNCLAQEFKLKEEKIRPASRFREDLGFDSIDSLRVVMVLEEEFGFEIPDDVPDKIFTVSEAVGYVFKRLTCP